jgi:hypothetical protein
MAEVIRFNATASQEIELHRKVWNLLFDVPASKLSAEQYGLIYSVCGEQWRTIYEQNKPKVAAD